MWTLEAYSSAKLLEKQAVSFSWLGNAGRWAGSQFPKLTSGLTQGAAQAAHTAATAPGTPGMQMAQAAVAGLHGLSAPFRPAANKLLSSKVTRPLWNKATKPAYASVSLKRPPKLLRGAIQRPADLVAGAGRTVLGSDSTTPLIDYTKLGDYDRDYYRKHKAELAQKNRTWRMRNLHKVKRRRKIYKRQLKMGRKPRKRIGTQGAGYTFISQGGVNFSAGSRF